MGLPYAVSGGFAITYEVDGKTGTKWAVRCFHREVGDLEDRYAHIYRFLKENDHPAFVDFQYQSDGIRVGRESHPILKMEWAKGKTLGEFLDAHHDNSKVLQALRDRFAALQKDLERLGIAHGDLQNGNVLVAPSGKIQLVDYDGMFVPGMREGQGGELGHKHFQHPSRSSSDFGTTIDRFSFIVIDLSLQAMIHDGTLFDEYFNSENILFTANDFSDPAHSDLFRALAGDDAPSLVRSVTDFRSLCSCNVKEVPTIDDFRCGRNIPSVAPTPVPKPLAPTKYIAPHDVINASQYMTAITRVGDRIELVGRVETVKSGLTKYNKPYTFVNFGDWKDDCVKITIWSEGVKALGRRRPDETWQGRWISVTGMMDPPYESKGARYRNKSVGITVTDATQIREINEDEARWRLGENRRPQGDNVPAGPSSRSVPSTNRDILDEIERTQGQRVRTGNRTASATQSSRGSSGCVVAVVVLIALYLIFAIS
jgi:hypothetical protein